MLVSKLDYLQYIAVKGVLNALAQRGSSAWRSFSDARRRARGHEPHGGTSEGPKGETGSGAPLSHLQRVFRLNIWVFRNQGKDGPRIAGMSRRLGTLCLPSGLNGGRSLYDFGSLVTFALISQCAACACISSHVAVTDYHLEHECVVEEPSIQLRQRCCQTARRRRAQCPRRR